VVGSERGERYRVLLLLIVALDVLHGLAQPSWQR
jgi:hypothetical protein